MRLLLLVLALLWAVPSYAGYCPPDRFEQRAYFPGEPRPVRDDPQTSGISPQYGLIALIVSIVAFFLGQATMMPDKKAIKKAVEGVFIKRQDEADTHGRLPRLSKPLQKALDGVEAELKKLGLWPKP